MSDIRIVKREMLSTPEFIDLIDGAAEDPYLGDFIYTRAYPKEYEKVTNDMVGFLYEGEAVGFAIPRRDSDGRYRTGPIYVKPGFRRKGIAKKFAEEYFANKRGRAYIEETNIASQSLYLSIGFKRTNKKMRDGKEVLYEYLKD